jgi:uncharacterized protein YfdQ (DUF2303 family)
MTENIDEGAAQIIRELARAAAKPEVLEPGRLYGYVDDAGAPVTIDLTGDQYRDFPRRKAGTVTVRNVASFERYYAKHSDDSSEVYADLDEATFTAVLDAHGPDDPRWERHRLVLRLEHGLPWKTWTSRDRQWMTQMDFAEFVEDNARDVAPGEEVSAADLLEVAQSFQAHTKVNFQQGTRLATGQTQLTYSETIEAKAGSRGEILIPPAFKLAIVPFEDCAPRVLGARFRYRLSNGDLRLGYFLDDPARVAREAVAEVASVLAATCEIAIMQGRPA